MCECAGGGAVDLVTPVLAPHPPSQADLNLRASDGYWIGDDPATNVSYVQEAIGYALPPSKMNYADVVCQSPCLRTSFDLPSPCVACSLAPTLVPLPFCGGSNITACASLPPPPAPPPYPDSTFFSNGIVYGGGNMKIVIEGEAKYLTPAFQAIAALYKADADAQLNQTLVVIVSFIPVYLSFFLLYIYLVFQPLVHHLNTEIQTKREDGADRTGWRCGVASQAGVLYATPPPPSIFFPGGMLLYLPLEIVANVKSLRLLIESISSKDQRRANPANASGAGKAAQ